MKIAEPGIALIKSYEKLRLVAYLPTPDDVWTCGWGSTKGVTKDTVWTEEEAEEHFREDIAHVERCINRRIQGIQITQNQYDALCSWVYNVGCGAFDRSTLLVHLLDGHDDRAAQEFGRWNKQNGKVLAGLTRRREAEKELFLA